jgi:hypothetical protein
MKDLLPWLGTLTAPQATVFVAIYSSLFAAAGWLVPKLFEAYIQSRREKRPQLLVDFERVDVPMQMPDSGAVRVLEITRRMFGKNGPGLRLIQGRPGSSIVWEGKAHGLPLWQRVARCVVTNITDHDLIDAAVYINAGMFQAVVEALEPAAASAGTLVPGVPVVVRGGGGAAASAHRLHHGALVARNDFEVIIRRLQSGESFEFYVVNVSNCFADVGPLEYATALIVGRRKRSPIQAIRTKNQFEEQRFTLVPPETPPEHEGMWPLMKVEVKEEK